MYEELRQSKIKYLILMFYFKKIIYEGLSNLNLIVSNRMYSKNIKKNTHFLCFLFGKDAIPR